MIAKTHLGVEFFDEQFGGIYRGRSTLVSGRADAGKTVLGLQFVAEGIRRSERCLLLSARPAADVIISASALGFPFDQAVDAGQLIVLEYSDYVPGRDREDHMTIPNEGFVQLQEIIDTNAVVRLVLDTALPWVAVPAPDHLAEHVFSFVRSFDRLGCTTLLTLPRPVSALAHKLRNALEDVVPVSISLNYDPDTESRLWLVNKYLGAKKLDQGVAYAILPGAGLVSANRVPAPEPVKPAAASGAPTPGAPAGAAAPPSTTAHRTRFSNVVLNRTPAADQGPPPTGTPSGRTFRWDAAIGRK
jgi:KaiC/GvpD/RAD55 family RecA-like ATPase